LETSGNLDRRFDNEMYRVVPIAAALTVARRQIDRLLFVSTRLFKNPVYQNGSFANFNAGGTLRRISKLPIGRGGVEQAVLKSHVLPEPFD